jgi:hypothetical protein
MTVEGKVLEKLRDLPPDKQKAVLDFVESLKRDSGKPTPLLSLEGLSADFDIHIALGKLEHISRWASSSLRVCHIAG